MQKSKQKFLIFETKRPVKSISKLLFLNSTYWSAFLFFSALFFVPKSPVFASAAAPAASNQCVQVTSIPKTGLFINNCQENLGDSGTGAEALQIRHTLYFNGNTLPASSNNSCTGCQITWYRTLNGNKNAILDQQNKVQFVDDQLTEAGYVISANAVIEGKNYSSEAKAADSVNATADYNKATVPNGLAGFISELVNDLVLLITGALYAITYSLVIPVIQVLLTMHVHDSSFSAVILGGWVFVRNIINIFFILTMVVIALATLFQLDEKKYGYKHLIPELVMMAVLVNFSLVIAQLILGIADTLQAQFLPNNHEVLSNLAYQLMVKPNIAVHVAPFTGSYATVVASFFYLFFAVGSFFAFFAIAAFLVIRVVMLWALLLLSPVAYGLRVLPATHHESSRWWSEFLKYAFFTPIIGFFLHVAASLAVGQADYMAKLTQAAIATGVQPGLAQFIESSLSSVLVIFFLYIGVEVAKEIGVVGVSSIMKKAEHYTVKPFEFAGEGIKDYGIRAKSRLTDKLVRGKDGNFREGAAGRYGRAAATVLTPIQTIKNAVAETHHATQEAQKLSKAQVQTIREYRVSNLTNDTGKDKELKKKHHDEEMAASLKRNTTHALAHLDKMRVQYGFDKDDKVIEKNEKAVEETLHQMEALVTKKNLEFAVRRFDERENNLKPGEGKFNREKIKEFAKFYSNKDDEVEHEILEVIDKTSKKTGYLVGVSIHENLSPEQFDKKISEVISNTDPAETTKINTSGLNPADFPGAVNTLKTILKNSGRNTVPKNQKEFIGEREDQNNSPVSNPPTGNPPTIEGYQR
ncbi:MAG: hypothetical protein NVS3B9_4300 [Candidatus Doudnabacteria bacterium]